MANVSVNGVSTSLEIVMFLAEQWISHKKEQSGMTTEQLIAKAEEDYAEAKSENEDLKKLGHE